MSSEEMAASVLECVGGMRNVAAHSLCATRLRITLRDAEQVDRNALHAIEGVLGIADRGPRSIEVVFGPNLVRSVYQSFVHLTGTRNASAPDEAAPRQRGNLHVRITSDQARPQHDDDSAQRRENRSSLPPTTSDDDTAALLGMLEDGIRPEPTAAAPSAPGPSLMVVNGPNINLLGAHGPDEGDYESLLELCRQTALEVGFSWCECYQSNHEGDLVDAIQDADGRMSACVINPTSLGPTSITLLDTVASVDVPCVEVQLEADEELEDFRRGSLMRRACVKSFAGLGIEGYRQAILFLASQMA